MVDLTDVDAVRAALILLCRDPLKRIVARALDVANRWEPMTVRDPDTRMFFTDDGAWNFIADHLQSGADVKCIPPSEKYPDHAYYSVSAQSGDRAIYMKIAIRPEIKKVIGLSFHYSDPR